MGDKGKGKTVRSGSSTVIEGLARGQRLLGRGRRAGESAPANAPMELPTLDRIIHERLRLGIVTALAANESLTFADLKRVLQTTDGNLSVHARKLEDAGYIACQKSFHARVPRSDYRLTAVGRRALEQYLNEMERFVRAARR
jgi:DNA-binding HxlR family transcriptional regulator